MNSNDNYSFDYLNYMYILRTYSLLILFDFPYIWKYFTLVMWHAEKILSNLVQIDFNRF